MDWLNQSGLVTSNSETTPSVSQSVLASGTPYRKWTNIQPTSSIHNTWIGSIKAVWSQRQLQLRKALSEESGEVKLRTYSIFLMLVLGVASVTIAIGWWYLYSKAEHVRGRIAPNVVENVTSHVWTKMSESKLPFLVIRTCECKYVEGVLKPLHAFCSFTFDYLKLIRNGITTTAIAEALFCIALWGLFRKNGHKSIRQWSCLKLLVCMLLIFLQLSFVVGLILTTTSLSQKIPTYAAFASQKPTTEEIEQFVDRISLKAGVIDADESVSIYLTKYVEYEIAVYDTLVAYMLKVIWISTGLAVTMLAGLGVCLSTRNTSQTIVC